MNQQLALAIQLHSEATLGDFHWGNNLLLRQHLYDLLDNKSNQQILYIWGAPGSGKSHLLQAYCQAEKKHQTLYLPLQMLKEFGPQVIDDLNDQAVLCIDDIDAIAGHKDWEEALLHLYNRVRDNGEGKLIVSAQKPPTDTPINLADLKSRLSWGLVIQLNELDDESKIETLQRHAEKRGIELPISVIQFLINRCARNMHDLHQLLNRLDEASLAAQRKITIPFVKQVLNI